MATTASFGDPVLDSVFQRAFSALQGFLEQRPDTDRLLAETVRLSEQTLSAGGAAIWVTEQPDHPELLLEHQLAALGLAVDAAPLPGLSLAVRRCVREGKPLIVPPFFVDHDGQDIPVNPSPYELFFAPLRLNGTVAMVMAVAVPPTMDTAAHRLQLAFLQRMLGEVEKTLVERRLRLMEKNRGDSTRIARFTEQVHTHLFSSQVSADIANLTRDVIAADRVTVELYPRLRRKVVAVSNVDEPNKRAAIFQAQRLVLDYVRDRNVPVLLDREAARQLVSDPMLQDAAMAYFMASNFNAFLAAPIRENDKVLGVMLTEYKSVPAAQEQSAILAELARISGGAVRNAMEYEAIPLRRTLHAVSQLWRKSTSTRRYVLASLSAVAIILFFVLCVIPFDFSIKTDCAVQPVAQLGIVAPMEGRIVEVPVHAGEHVYAKKDIARLAALGITVKPLVVFDTTDLLASRAEAQQKQAEFEVQLKDLQDKREISKIGAVQLQLKQIRDQVKLLDHQIDEATVYSPIEGTVLTENIEQKKWASVKLGDPLLEVASFNDWVLVVDVPESEAATVRDALATATRHGINDGRPQDPGIEVEYIFYPWPDTRYALRARGVATLLPASAQSKNANVFRLQVPVDPAGLPPGIAMSGVTGRAKVHVGRKPLIRQWTRGATRLLKMTTLF